jgi:hypothetical protein
MVLQLLAIIVLHRRLLAIHSEWLWMGPMRTHSLLLMATTERVILSCNSLCSILIVPSYRAITICMAKRTCTQSVELSSKFLNARLQLCVCLTQTSVFRLHRLVLLLLSHSALCCCNFVVLAELLFLLDGLGVGFAGATVAIAYPTGFPAFTMPLVCRMAGPACWSTFGREWLQNVERPVSIVALLGLCV